MLWYSKPVLPESSALCGSIIECSDKTPVIMQKKEAAACLFLLHSDLGIDETVCSCPLVKSGVQSDEGLSADERCEDSCGMRSSFIERSKKEYVYECREEREEGQSLGRTFRDGAFDSANKINKKDSLLALQKELMALEGCPIKNTASSTVFGAGDINSKIMLVGEAPGAEEDKQGLPFVGMSGKLLDKMFASIGIRRDSLYVSNIIPWRPPGNRQPTSSEIALCLPFIEKHIAIIDPEVIVFVGGVALKALVGKSSAISVLQGKFLAYSNRHMSRKIKGFAIYHPAYLLRSPGQKRVAWAGLLRFSVDLALDHNEI
ncbi:uracil-DNA glycosylase [Candidatus Hydrogenosomobacter endosymbioticus]|uniref:Type-4 uracil-DNA glycosylase n=1 Tax=Candidatus Hydrogenosomobacter endosymbioticus TaxID=2558174 RepID=A0ABN6L3D8_9PROT|nr:uracil-DNA glycosylase [Candidatus Hydrogenosomobacter endosymbioticus]BDB96072.1 hypothetical protein HYD_2050 [Candidatus Hydrogenosomobacter endosymbioticus]